MNLHSAACLLRSLQLGQEEKSILSHKGPNVVVGPSMPTSCILLQGARSSTHLLNGFLGMSHSLQVLSFGRATPPFFTRIQAGHTKKTACGTPMHLDTTGACHKICFVQPCHKEGSTRCAWENAFPTGVECRTCMLYFSSY